MANPLSDKIQQFLQWEAASRDCIEVKRSYVKVAGDLVAGVLLSQIIYWNLPTRDGKSKLRVSKEGKYWIAKTREEWSMECCISVYQFDRAVELLARKGLIEAKRFRFNNAPTTHIWLNIPVLIDAISKIPDFRLSINSEKSKLGKLQNLNLEKVEEHELGLSPSSLTETTTENTTKTTILSSSDSPSNIQPVKPKTLTPEEKRRIVATHPGNPQRKELCEYFRQSMKRKVKTDMGFNQAQGLTFFGEALVEHDIEVIKRVIDLFFDKPQKLYNLPFFITAYANLFAELEGALSESKPQDRRRDGHYVDEFGRFHRKLA